MEPLISIIMPAYNCQEYIKQSIDSVLNQTYTNIELLIADDCSTDSTKSIIDSYTDSRIKTYHNTANKGYLQTSNKLLALCTGSYIAFQDADDYTDADRIELQYQYLINNPAISVVGCNLAFISHTGVPKNATDYTATGDVITDEVINGQFNFSPNTFLFKKEVYDSVGGYNLFFDRIGSEDYYWTLLILSKYKLTNLHFAKYIYRLNPVSITGDQSDNPRKVYSSSIVMHLAKQRKANGTDDLAQGNVAAVEAKMNDLVGPFLKDKALFYHTLGKRYFYEGKKTQAINIMYRAIKLKPLRVGLYRDLLYFIRKDN